MAQVGNHHRFPDRYQEPYLDNKSLSMISYYTHSETQVEKESQQLSTQSCINQRRSTKSWSPVEHV